MLARVGQRALPGSLVSAWTRSLAVEGFSQFSTFDSNESKQTTHLPTLPERKRQGGLLASQKRDLLPSTMSLLAKNSFTARSFAADAAKSADPSPKFPVAPSTNVGLYLGGLAALHITWMMGAVDWMVTINTSFVQSAVWITAISLISPAAVWTSLKRHVHVENEETVRGAQLSSGVKIV